MADLSPALREMQAGRLDRAEAACLGVLAAEPDHPDALDLLAFVRFQRGDLANALAAAGRAIATRPADARARFNRAMIHETAGDDEKAGADYAEACRLDPANLAARINLGGLLLRHDRLEEAAAYLSEALRLDPRAAAAHECLGIVRQRQDRMAEALTALRQAAALAPGTPRVEANLARVLLENGEAEEAALRFGWAASSDPKIPDYAAGQAAALMRLGRWAEALTATDRALAAQPGHIQTLALRPVALDALGRVAERRILVDLDRLLWRRRHATPPGFADMAAFNAALRQHVLGHPTLMRDRPGKTTRHGSQTDDLLAGEPGPVRALAALIADAVETYGREALPADGPFSARHRPARWRLRIWATVLEASGYQDPHHHPTGWLSGVYYVRVPPGVGTAPGDTAGWIEFGRPDPFYPLPVEPELRLIQPEEGTMLLFPAYFWHRTVPFAGREPRISIAFDLVPA